jgi:hypothetical protein
MDFGGIAHQVVVVDALAALAGSDVGEDLGQAAVGTGIDKRGAVGMVFGAAHRDGGGVAICVVVKGTVRYAAVRDVRCHWKVLLGRPPRTGGSCVYRKPARPNQKDPIMFANSWFLGASQDVPGTDDQESLPTNS